MQVTLRQIAESWQSLKKLGDIQAGDGLTLKQAYWVGRLIAAAEAEVQRIDKLRGDLFTQYGETVDNEMRIKAEHVQTFTSEVESLLAETIELPGQQFALNDLSDKLPLSAVDLVRLDWLITE